MASSATPVTFFGACKKAFYFHVAETDADVEGDAFKISIQYFKHRLQSKDNKFLLLNAEGQFQVQHLTTQQQSQPDCEFTIHIYNDLEESKGRAVMLYANKDSKKIVACCSEKNEIHPEAMDLPNKIEGTTHKALFYLRQLPASNKYMFQSSVYPCKFLGFEPVKDNPCLNKLVLHEKGHDELDESSVVILSD